MYWIGLAITSAAPTGILHMALYRYPPNGEGHVLPRRAIRLTMVIMTALELSSSIDHGQNDYIGIEQFD